MTHLDGSAKANTEVLSNKIVQLSSRHLGELVRMFLGDASGKTIERVNAVLEKALGPALEERKKAFLKEYNIEVVADRQVRVALNGKSRIEILRAMNEVATEIYGRPAIDRLLLEDWGKSKKFTASPPPDRVIGVEGNVKNSTNKTRAEQEAKGWNNVDLCDLALAHTAYFLATGKDLFEGRAVRARRGALFFNFRGLSYHACRASFPYPGVAASRALPSRN